MDYTYDYNYINFNFDKYKSNQPYNRYKLIIPFIQFMNKTYCKIYMLILYRWR